MPPPTAPAKKGGIPTVPPSHYDWTAALLGYLVPGLGQIYQGRVGKGLLFLVCLYTLFFYGMYLGSWKNVYINNDANAPAAAGQQRTWVNGLIAKSRYFGQFPIGVAAWPALLQYNSKEPPAYLGNFKDFQRAPTEDELNRLQVNGDKTWDLGWVYTVIAGVLNVMVIYDALVGPAFVAAAGRKAAGGAAAKLAPSAGS
jgi:TM2 domain-containing membrane protein YozV